MKIKCAHTEIVDLNELVPNPLNNMYGSNFELLWSKNKHKQEIINILSSDFLGHNKKEDGQLKIHPTQKLVKLHEFFINKFTKENDIIVDLFSGSGSILIACQKLNRKCYSMEIDPYYCDIIVKRYEEYSKTKAIKL